MGEAFALVQIVKSQDDFKPQERIPATSNARVIAESCPSTSEGAGNAGRSMRPQPRVVVKNTRVSHHGHTGVTRHSPRNGFNGFLRGLPGEPGLLSPSPP
jgi:hypothetical protein